MLRATAAEHDRHPDLALLLPLPLLSYPAERVEGLRRVGDQVRDVLQADREPDRTWIDPGRGQRRVVELPVCGGRHVTDLGMRPTQRRGHLGHPQPVSQRVPASPSAMRGHRDNRAKPGALRAGINNRRATWCPGWPGSPG